jgi:hypothetical protein
VREYMAARLMLKAALRGGIEVVHGVPLLVSGMPSNGEFALRDIFTWLGHIITGTMPDTNTVLPSTAVFSNLSMPADIETKSYVVFEMRQVVTDGQNGISMDIDVCNILILYMTELGCAYVAQQSAVTEDPDTDGDKNPFFDCRFIFVGSSQNGRSR